MKQLSALLCCLAFALALSACGAGGATSSSSASSGSSSHRHAGVKRSHRTSHRKRTRYGTSSAANAFSRAPKNLPPSKNLGPRSKTSGCQVHGASQDSACTPGAIFVGVTKSQICVLGYSRRVRNVSSSTKRAAYREYGIASHTRGQYEVDHLVSLELGGSNSIANLWPEAAQPTPGFHEKDQVENYLHQQVCNGRVSLQQAQHEIATNWLAVYHKMGH